MGVLEKIKNKSKKVKNQKVTKSKKIKTQKTQKNFLILDVFAIGKVKTDRVDKSIRKGVLKDTLASGEWKTATGRSPIEEVVFDYGVIKLFNFGKGVGTKG